MKVWQLCRTVTLQIGLLASRDFFLVLFQKNISRKMSDSTSDMEMRDFVEEAMEENRLLQCDEDFNENADDQPMEPEQKGEEKSLLQLVLDKSNNHDVSNSLLSSTKVT